MVHNSCFSILTFFHGIWHFNDQSPSVSFVWWRFVEKAPTSHKACWTSCKNCFDVKISGAINFGRFKIHDDEQDSIFRCRNFDKWTPLSAAPTRRSWKTRFHAAKEWAPARTLSYDLEESQGGKTYSVLMIYIDQMIDLEQIDELCTVHKTVDIKCVNEC
jgi:hypothetical protein